MNSNYYSTYTVAEAVLPFLVQVRYLKDNRFGGAMVWALDLDDFSGQFCGDGNYTLISYLRSLLESGQEKKKSTLSVRGFTH